MASYETISYRCSPGSPVDWIWFSKGEDVNIHQVCYPFLHAEYVINLGGAFNVCNYHNSYRTDNYHSWISGLHTAPLSVKVQGVHKAAGILFKPWGLYQSLGISPRGLTDLAVDAKVIYGPALDEFFAELCEGTPDLKRAEEFIVKNSKQHKADTRIVEAVDAITPYGIQRGMIKQRASELKRTSKTVISRFKDATGVTPVEYLHLKLIEIARVQIRHDRLRSLTDIALGLGFYDQAHFTRVFKKICRITPREYRKSLAT